MVLSFVNAQDFYIIENVGIRQGLENGIELKQVIIINKELKMSAGKIVSAGAHASVGAYRHATKEQIDKWNEGSKTKKVCLSVDTTEELINLYKEAVMAGLPTHLVNDGGITEVEPGSNTALGIGPGDDNEIDTITGHLKLYK